MENNLYSLSQQYKDENQTKSKISLNPKHPIFKGHFPENPILPGVVLIDLFKKEAEKYSVKKLQINSIKNMKFLRVVKVEEEIELELLTTFKTFENKLQLNGKAVDAQNNVVAKLQLDFIPFEA